MFFLNVVTDDSFFKMIKKVSSIMQIANLHENNEYLKIVIYFLGSSVLVVALVIVAYIIGLYTKTDNRSKKARYECGLKPYGNARLRVNSKFYLVGLLFLLFDLEILFLYPWCVSLAYLDNKGFWLGFIFIIILTIGFFFEWYFGALDWNTYNEIDNYKKNNK